MAVRQYYSRPDNVITTNYVNATNGNIITTILDAYPLAVMDCQKHAKILKSGDFEKDCATIWNVLKTELTYKRDLDELQTIALPRMAFSRVKNDCKSFSLCAAGLIGAMGYIAIIRFAGYKKNNPYIVDIDEAGNPLLYYISIINYLNNNSVITLFIRNATNSWKDKVSEGLKKLTHLPHIIVLEVYDEMAKEFNKKPISFIINEAKYQIDSTVVRDISKQHFCSTITCEKKEMAYDGMSFHRLESLEWKEKLNTNFDWRFEGTTDYDGSPLVWNYTKCYQMLIYYRVE